MVPENREKKFFVHANSTIETVYALKGQLNSAQWQRPGFINAKKQLRPERAGNILTCPFRAKEEGRCGCLFPQALPGAELSCHFVADCNNMLWLEYQVISHKI